MILITGATGMVGRHLVPQLAAAGWSLRVAVEPDRPARVRWPDGVEVVRAGLNDLKRCIRRCRACIPFSI